MSWIIINKETGKAELEIYSSRLAEKVNPAKYTVMKTAEYLAKLNKSIKHEAKND